MSQNTRRTLVYATHGEDLYQANPVAAGLDLKSRESRILWPLVPVKINTGTRFILPDNTVGLVQDRSSMGAKGIRVLGGVIDEDYTGDVSVILVNLSWRPRRIREGDRIAQMLVLPRKPLRLQRINDQYMPESNGRGDKGFGSTGR